VPPAEAGDILRFNLSLLQRAVREKEQFMSRHRSLKSGSELGGKRNVLRRYERVAILKERRQWKEGDRVTGLRKTKHVE
tara:strand:- start:48 stop:284 length:237 start_codon:yes stop_codon:yes gene_type:complete